MSNKQVTVTLSRGEIQTLEWLLMAEGGRKIIAGRKYRNAGRDMQADDCNNEAQACVELIAKLRGE